MRKQNFGRSLLIACIPGAVLPLFFSFALGLYTNSRDVLPSFDHPLAMIGGCGMAIFAIPLYAIMFILMLLVNYVWDQGYLIPVFDSLTSDAQVYVMMAIGLIGNVIFWLIAVLIYQRIKRERAQLSIASNNYTE